LFALVILGDLLWHKLYDARLALEHLGIEIMPHNSRKLNEQDIEEVDRIWCMTDKHRDLVLEKFPKAKYKINFLDVDGSIPVPHGNGLNTYIECARKLEQLIDGLIMQKEIKFS